MRTFHWLALGSSVVLVASGIVACSTPPPPAPPEPVLVPAGTIREVMKAIVEPSSQALFDSVAVVASEKGTIERVPSTDEEWEQLEHWALTLAEAPNLIKVKGRRVARPEEENTSAGPTELPPIQIQAKIEANPQQFYEYLDALQAAAVEALNIVKNRDVKGLFEVGEKLDVACENCHVEFWYPEENK